MDRFEKQWRDAAEAVGNALEQAGQPAEAARLTAGLERLSFLGRLIVLADPSSGDVAVGDELLTGAAGWGARQPSLRAAGIDADTIEAALRALLVERRPPSDLLANERLQTAAVEAAARFLGSRGVAVSPEESATALRLLTSGELFRDIGAATSAILHVVPTLPLALARDVPRTPWIVLGRLVPALLLDVPGLPFAVAKAIGGGLLEGRMDGAPSALPRTLRVLYDLASLRSIAETIRTLIGRDNESFRLALILYARANGVPLTPADLDVLHDSVLNPDAPDLGPALQAAVAAYLRRGQLGRFEEILTRFRLPDDADPNARTRALDASPSVALAAEPETRFEGIVFRPTAGAAESPAAIVARVLGPDWAVVPFSPSAPLDFEAVPLRAVTVSEGWDATHRLTHDPQVDRAEPELETHVPTEERRARSGLGGRPVDPATADRKWSPKLVRAFDAWALEPGPGGLRHGDGILVGHPDTGYTPHPELAGRLVPGRDFLDEDDDALDPLKGGLPWRFPGHGTGTASVLASPDEPDADKRMTGVAPWAQIMPLRVSTSVVHLSLKRVTKAIRHAVDQGCHVISMSLGSPFGFDYCHEAVQYAVERGVIVVAAAGNEVGFVTYPAAFPEALAVGGCDVNRRPWDGSSRGPAVDISAPAADVWKAATGGEPGEIAQSSGTSFATATVAGVAALWLAFHDRDRLIATYGAAGVPRLFIDIVQRTCQPGTGWPVNELGPGIVDAAAVLKEPLPPASPRARAAVVAADPVSAVEHHFPELTPAEVRAGLSALLQVPAAGLVAHLQPTGLELPMHLVTDRELRREFLALARPPRPRALGAPLAPADAAPIRSRLRALGSPQLQPIL